MKYKFNKAKTKVNITIGGYCTDDFIVPDHANIILTIDDTIRLLEYMDLFNKVSKDNTNITDMRFSSGLVEWFYDDSTEIDSFEYPIAVVCGDLIRFTAINKYSDYYLNTDHISRTELMTLLNKYKGR